MFTFKQFLKGLLIYIVIALIIIYAVLPRNLSTYNPFQGILLFLVAPVAFPIMVVGFAG